MPGVPPLDPFLIPSEELECIYYDLSGGKVYDEDGEIEGWLDEKGISSFSESVLQLDGFVRDLVVGGAVREAFVAGVEPFCLLVRLSGGGEGVRFGGSLLQVLR